MTEEPTGTTLPCCSHTSAAQGPDPHPRLAVLIQFAEPESGPEWDAWEAWEATASPNQNKVGRGCSRQGGASVHTKTTGPGRAGCLTPGHRSMVQTAAPGPRRSCTRYTPWAPVRLGQGASGRRRGCHTHCGLWEGGITLPDPLPCPSWAFLISLPLSGACRPLLWVQALTGCSATGH